MRRRFCCGQGGIPRAIIEQRLGHPLAGPAEAAGDNVPVAPGQLASHYAPRTPLRLNAEAVRPGEALLAFGNLPPGAEQAIAVRNLSTASDLVEAAANLFSHLRALDAAGAATIAVMAVPPTGLGEAINDRLQRGAAVKPSTAGPDPA